jgi:membrane-bound inhibitor of C-type lysozyme
MTKQLITLACGIFCLATSCAAETLTVTVLNEQNKGIRSRVVYKSGSDAQVLGDTNDDGALIKDLSCTPSKLISAKPFDKGSYFESTEEPCQRKVTLRVLSRQTPKGYAVNWRIQDFTLKDGSPALIAYKGFVNTDFAPTANNVGCAVDVNSAVQQEVFKVDGATWTMVTKNVVDSSSLFYDLAKSPKAPILVPYKCSAAQSRIQVLNANAAGTLSQQLSTGTLSLSNSLTSLGLR